VELNKAIEDAAEDDSKNILQQDFDSLAIYPPNGGFTDEEKVALRWGWRKTRGDKGWRLDMCDEDAK
jgi:hypothetical protein